MTSNDFVHLHVHTEFSLLDGLSRIDTLVKRAQELGMNALAITDHGTMFGVMDFFRACQNAGIKPIIGVEAYLARRAMADRDPREDRKSYHLLLLARNQTGYQNLLKIASAAQLEGYYYNPRIDRDFLAAHADGLIATSGCLAAQIPSAVMAGRDEEARELIGWYQDVFGKDYFFLELQHHDIAELQAVNAWLIENRAYANALLVATNDVHYVMAEDHDPHDTLLCIQTGALKSDANRLRMSDASYYLKSQAEMWRDFGGVLDGAPLKNTRLIAEMCEVDLSRKGYHLPVFPVPAGFTAASYLRYLCEKGLVWRFGPNAPRDPALTGRLNRELEIIHSMGFDTYFLIVWDLCEYARHADIWWNVRGSGAGSLAAYCLGITNIDPIQNNLLFERFLNPGRVSMPDIDLDYPDDRRAEMIDYTARKYGEDKVAAIITFGTLGAKAAVRDVGRVLNVPLADVNQAAALIPTEPKPKPLMTYVEENQDLKRLYREKPQIKQVIDTATALQGVSRHASTHAAGVIVADRPLVEYIPLHRPTRGEDEASSIKAMTQFPMETCESIGLLKIDFLGLSTLTILRKVCDLIAQHRGIRYTMDNIPYRHEQVADDPEKRAMLDAVFAMLGRGETVGVFQMESSGMQQMLRGMRPQRFENIVAGISLYRPGPMDYIPTYNARLHGDELPHYHHEKLEPILAETYGIIVYQEQIMQIAGQLFGYELGEADLMRRAVSKKKEKDLLTHKAIFMERGPQNGIDAATAERIFNDIALFANYGFNKSHAADYAVITMQTAFLKAHYPEEYMTALLTVHRDDTAKVAVFLEECRRLEIPILPPDVNRSQLDFDIQALGGGRRGIRFGLAAVKNVGLGPLRVILAAREAGGPFASLDDFCRRVDLRLVGKRALDSLVRVGAFDSLGKRAALLAALDRLLNYSASYHKDREAGQINMFGGDMALIEDTLHIPDAPDIARRELLNWEKELLGLYVTGRPADRYRNALRVANTADIRQLKESESINGLPVVVAGEIVSVRRLYTRSNEAMGVIHLEDWHETAGTVDVVLFPRTWAKCQDLAVEGEIVKVTGKWDTSRGEPQIIADSLTQKFDAVAPVDHSSLPPQPLPWSEPAQALRVEDDETLSSVLSDYFDEKTGEAALPQPEPALEAYVAPATRGAAAVPVPAIEPQLVSLAADAPPTGNPARARHWVYVYLRRSGDDDVDRRRLRRLHNILTSFSGDDRFSIVVETQGGWAKLEFPNHTTEHCDELLEELLTVVRDPQDICVFDRPD